jgi:hypothetical protein
MLYFFDCAQSNKDIFGTDPKLVFDKFEIKPDQHQKI